MPGDSEPYAWHENTLVRSGLQLEGASFGVLYMVEVDDMQEEVIDLWGDIGSEDYWRDLPVHKNRTSVPFESVYVPFRERWPQPGFIGKGYYDSAVRVLVVGQNPRASNNPASNRGDKKMFGLIRGHSHNRSADSLQSLFSMMRRFMAGDGCGRPWGVVADIAKLNLELDSIAYLNLIPLATWCDELTLVTHKCAYARSTKLQLKLLNPHKVLFHGKTPYKKFHKWENNSDRWNTNFLERIRGKVKCDPQQFAEVKEWLRT